ncbi:BlaI/MecI/CopY family transcriptional regulator [Acanthopleuribacter pedis]|uniref:BlaI/MecI/CopY family transcriptional regulator n=1 Tax=Acanthopleuribacter pedis TaxID=442870 RepID=A0A8J7U4L6_9BACT|nr:BlaI/MecI/CopY family transcriptional regulator [Acanthopleuribacter pedis]MBO1319919.1 BlaI/MecI/CopY family transcriptional regulator [Acanthopleuribacter pedis]
MSSKPPSQLETQILGLLWREGPLTARQVLEQLPDGKSRAYTSVLSTMQVMEKKGLLDHQRQGKTHVYRPLVEKEEVLRPVWRDLLRNFFSGRPAAAMQHLINESEVDAAELDEIRALLDQKAAKRKD